MSANRGFTLVELIVFIVIVSIAALAVTGLFVQNVRHSHEPLLRQQAINLASAYMDEILHKRWDAATPIGGGCVRTASAFGASGCADGPPVSGNLGPEPGETRRDYDDVDDYAAIVAQQPPRDAEDVELEGFENFSVTVTVEHPEADWHGIAASDVKRIRVEVTTPLGERISLTGYRVNY